MQIVTDFPLPAPLSSATSTTWGDSCTYDLPQDAELMYSSYLELNADSFEIRQENGVLKIIFKDYPNSQSGPYGIYTLYLPVGKFLYDPRFHRCHEPINRTIFQLRVIATRKEFRLS